MHILDNWR